MLPHIVIAPNWDDVSDWLAGDGARILGVVAVALLIDLAIHRIVPHALRLAIERQMRDASPEEVEQRSRTLASVFTGTGRAIISVIALLTLLPLAGVNITAIVTGFGITGLALALGAQAGVLHSIPNGTISVVSNFTRDYAQVNLEVRVAYGEDLSRVAAVIDRVGRELAADARYKPLISEAPRRPLGGGRGAAPPPHRRLRRRGRARAVPAPRCGCGLRVALTDTLAACMF